MTPALRRAVRLLAWPTPVLRIGMRFVNDNVIVRFKSGYSPVKLLFFE